MQLAWDLLLPVVVFTNLIAARPQPLQSQRLQLTHSKYYFYEIDENVANSGNNTAHPILQRPTPENYFAERELFSRLEEAKSLGSDIALNDREILANQIIMDVKMKEFAEGLLTPHLFAPSQHLFSVLDEIKKSPLFAFISQMPKGGALHAHDTALGSTDYLIKASYRTDLWACQRKGSHEAMLFRFSKEKPANIGEEEYGCDWDLVSDVRKRYGDKRVDEYLRQRFTLYPTEKFEDINDAWSQFRNIFNLLDGLITYVEVWSDYYYNALDEFHKDGVQYLEFRTTLPTLYDMEETNYTELDTVRIYTETLKEFMESHPDFIGSKMIYAPIRLTDANGLENYIRVMNEIVVAFPDFVAGFDLVGQEELGRPLKDFVPQLLSMPETINFYFHAGETNWHGSSIDENLVDAVLLGTKRIGHGFALTKHPLVLQMLKERDIAVEVNPISNQVLNLVADLRNHPCAYFFSDNYPIVISSDDPSFWKASPLSHDFYAAFLGIASAHADIRLLKKLALNSLKYSSLSTTQKAEAMLKWEVKWNAFIEEIIKSGKNAAPGFLGFMD